MAKFSRFDPRNKKRDRNKQNSMYKDLRIRMEEEKGRRKHRIDVTGIKNVAEDEDDYEQEDRI